MRNWATNPVKYESIIVAEALFLTIVIHIGLLFLFGYARPTAKVDLSDSGYASMLNLETLSEASRHSVVMFLDYNDPQLISRPQIDLISPGSRIVPDQPRQDRVIPIGDDANIEEPGVIDVGESGGMPIIRRNTNHDLEKATPVVLPVAISATGTMVKLVLTESESALVDDMELKPTVLMLYASSENELIGRFAVLSSCGRNALDLVAVRQLQEHRFTLLGGEPSIQVSVWWQEKKP